MKIAVVYILPHIRLDKYRPMARRFVATYLKFPPGHDHRLFVIVNGAKPDFIHKEPFSGVEAEFLHHTNFGKDIGAYQIFAERYSSKFDLMVCFGTPVHFRRAGWLERMMQCYEQFGPGLYGAYGFHQPRLHIRTTSFWLPPPLMNSYPYTIADANRYVFEHGENSITAYTMKLGYPVMRVTWSKCVDKSGWNHVTNEEALILDQHTDRAGYK